MFCKADCAGYEGLAEACVTQLFDVVRMQVPYVRYQTANFYDMQTQQFCGRGCICGNYNSMCCTEIDLKQLLQQQGKLEYVLNLGGLARYNAFTQILPTHLLSYLLMLTVIDTLILNDDRHFMNVRFFVTANGLQAVPIFDNGAALFSDESLYSFKKSLFENRSVCINALWGTNYEETLHMLQCLGVNPLRFNEMQIQMWLNTFTEGIYNAIEVQRCKEVLTWQLRETKGLLWQAI